ncbi:unnamed protein product [Rotaria sordida]|uniref:Cation-transporting P-type ATPase C-terminal domain-containing protein n=1 Tax=Rotaria sordida TaxID=392033 RepID=A0A814TYF1_9BILA|nr:unnamed protein product [Rotaria sordida]
MYPTIFPKLVRIRFESTSNFRKLLKQTTDIQVFTVNGPIFVLAVPVDLSSAITLSLTYVAKKMMNDNNLVRHLDACETIEIIIPANTKEILFECVSVNSSYSSILLPSIGEETLSKQIGNQIDCSLLNFINTLDGNYNEIRRNYPEDKFIHVYKFKLAQKTMSTIIQRSNSTIRMYTKGTSKIILKKCNTILNRNGDIIPFSHVDYDHLVQTVIEPMTCDGLDTICIAYRDFSSDDLPDWNNETSVVDQLTCICVCGIEDRIRSEIPDAIAKFRNAGIIVRMVTEDNVNTARSIALKCGIISSNDDYLILEGEEFNRRIRSTPHGKVEQNLFDKVWPNLRVLACASSQDKYVLVRGIMASKINPTREIVAITGCHNNDVRALKAADIGFSMGIQGIDAVKQASDIILLDDNFNSIFDAVIWGRSIYDPITKIFQFKLIVNFVTLLCVFIGACIVKESPLRIVQMFWIHLIIVTLASLTLASEVSTEDLFIRKSNGRRRSLISSTMMKNIICHVFYQLTVIAFILFAGPKVFDIDDDRSIDSRFKPSKLFTIIFNVFVFMTLFNEINCRKIHGEKNIFHKIFTNSTFYGIWIVLFIVQIIIVQYGSFVFSCVALTFKQWIWCLVFGVSVLLWHQVINLIPITCHIPMLGTNDVDETVLPVALDSKEQSRLGASLTQDKTLVASNNMSSNAVTSFALAHEVPTEELLTRKYYGCT